MIKSPYQWRERERRPLRRDWMARYKKFNYSQGKFIPVHFDRQILPGTFEYSFPIFNPVVEVVF
jgi:hypothetical protein